MMTVFFLLGGGEERELGLGLSPYKEHSMPPSSLLNIILIEMTALFLVAMHVLRIMIYWI